uniref:HMA domain-containing protein n=1 Tax=Cucumis melo TaxID=3656 RepID=A0A9I9D324_CUCME
MAAVVVGIGVRKQRIFPHASSLASIESLSLPLVQEIVLTADIGCAECQKKLADILSKMNGEFLLCFWGISFHLK